MLLVEGDVAKSSTHLKKYYLVKLPDYIVLMLLFPMKKSAYSFLNNVFKDAAATRQAS
jgi:hypothetical protein